MGLELPPLDVLLSWPKPNYINPVTRGPETYVIGTVFLFFSTLAVIVRLYARLFIRRWFGLDDLFICLAWLSTVAVAVIVYLGLFREGWDRHVYDVELYTLATSGKAFWLAAVFWALSSSFIRLSLVCFYYRLVEHIQIRRYIWGLHAVVLISILFLLSYIMTLFFMCIPLDAVWGFPGPGTKVKCIHIAYFLFAINIINTVLELFVALLPIPVIFHLKMGQRERRSVAGVLCLGVLVFMAGCVRCAFVYKGLVVTWDTTWWAGPEWVCSEVENNLALICACAPALRPLFGRFFNKDPVHPRTTSDSRPLIPRIMPTLKPREHMHYSTRNNEAWFDLEGIANDGLGYTVNIISKEGDYHVSIAEKARRRHLSSETGTSTLKNSGLIDLVLTPNSAMKTSQSRVQSGDSTERKTGDEIRVWKIDQPIFKSPLTDPWPTPTAPVQTLETDVHSPWSLPEPSRQRGPINPLNSSQQWVGPNIRSPRRSRYVDNPTLPIIQPRS